MAILTRIASLLAALTIFHLTSGAEDREALAPFLGIRYQVKYCDNLFGAHQMMDWLNASITLAENEEEYTLTRAVYREYNGKSEVTPLKFKIGQTYPKDVHGKRGYFVMLQNGTTLTELQFVSKGLPKKTLISFTPLELKEVCRIGAAIITCGFKPQEKDEES